MTHKPQHSHNPCALPDNQQTPAKIWELLRRNEKFQRSVARLDLLDARVRKAQATWTKLEEVLRSERSPTPPARESPSETELALERARVASSVAWEQSCRMLGSVRAKHPFAAIALQWLVPEPLFRLQRWEAPLDYSGFGRVSLRLVSMGEGTTPNLKDRNHWRWFRSYGEFDASSRANFAGHLLRRGPELCWRTSSVPDFADKVNPIIEWRDYFAKHQFTLDTPWRDAPPGFQRTFFRLWCQLDSRGTNPITNTRSDAPERHEVSFFQDFSCYRMLTAITDRGHLSAEDFAHALRFAEVADNYRVFAFPRSIRTRTEARNMADWLVEQLVQLPNGSQLPQREKEILGTPLLWDILLAYEDRRRQGDAHTHALQYTFDTLYAHQPAARRHAAKPVERTFDATLRHIVAKKLVSAAESARWHSWQDDFARIHSPLAGTGLIQRIFPRLASVLPPTPAPAAP